MNTPLDMSEQLNDWREAMEGVQASLKELNATEEYYRKVLTTTEALGEDPTGFTPTWVGSLGLEGLSTEDLVREPIQKQGVIQRLKDMFVEGFHKAMHLMRRVMDRCQLLASKLLPIINRSRYQINYIVEHDLKNVTVKEIDEARFNAHFAKVEPYHVLVLWMKKSPAISKSILELIQNPEGGSVEQITTQLRTHFFKKTDPTEIAKYNPYTPDRNQLPVSQDIEFYMFPYNTKLPVASLKSQGYTPANSIELLKLAAYTMNVVAGTLQAVDIKAKKQGLFLVNLYGENRTDEMKMLVSDVTQVPVDKQRKYVENAKWFAELLWYLELFKRYSVYFNTMAVIIGKQLAAHRQTPMPAGVDLEAKAKKNLDDQGMNVDKDGHPGTPPTTVQLGASAPPPEDTAGAPAVP